MIQMKIHPQGTHKNLSCFQTDRDDISLRLQLEGECKIQQVKLLQISYIKSCFLLIPLLVSLIGLIFLKYYKTFRSKVFYCEADRFNASHIYVKGNGKENDEIVPVIYDNGKIYFFFKNLKYELINDQQFVPAAVNFEIQLHKRFNPQFLSHGHSKKQAQEKMKLYGRNQHIVQAPLYFEYLYEIMTQPFFFVQYLASVVYIVQKLQSLAILLLAASVITTSINYILLYISYKKIKQIAQQAMQVQILRDGQFEFLQSTQIVPGDIFVIKRDDQLTCDVILLQGQVYVNQANLTGQSVPIGKFGLQSIQRWKKNDSSRWIYQGSKILSAQNAMAMAIHTGYTSKRGRILRKIIHRNASAPHFFKTCMFFLLENYIVGVILYLGTLPLRLTVTPLQPVIIFLNFLLIITFCFPPSAPIYFNLVYSFSLLRLKSQDILGTQPQKTVEAAHLKIMCFDKTGTLTQDKVEVNKVYKFLSQRQIDITNRSVNERMIDYKIFGSCHNVKYFEQKFMGDEIDLKMFYHSGYQLVTNCQPEYCFQVNAKLSLGEVRLRILKIYQYQSRFQSMSVMVYDCETDKYYIFVKGAPQVLHSNSITKYSYFDHLLQDVSYGGFRSIAYGFKEISPNQKDKWLNQSRQNFLSDISILGLLVFENKLKKDSASTISLLGEAAIESRMITGDNVYIAIETAIRCGILNREEQIVVIEGKQQEINQNAAQYIKIKTFIFSDQKVKILTNKIQYSIYMNINKSVVIDNDFLQLQKKIQGFQMTPNIKVYTRISPQNKAYIVKNLKKTISSKKKKLSKFKQLFEVEVDKVGMIGDGANDLLAIKQADIGVGIRNCDSSYAANFSVLQLSGLDEIVREAKCAQRIIIQIQRFVTISSFITVPLLIIMETQYSFFSSFQLILGNLTKSITFPILLCLSRPTKKPTVQKPCSNFLKMQNQLCHWGNVVIGTLAFSTVVWYYRRTEQYVWNTAPVTVESGWFYQTSLVTCTYLYFNIHPVALVFFIYESSPWKQPIYKNFLLFVWFIFNIFYDGALSFLVPYLKDIIKLTDMSYTAMGIIFGIGMIASFITFIFNWWLTSLNLHLRDQNLCDVSKQFQMGQMQMVQAQSSSQNEQR